MILAKSCHDMDIMLWFAGSDCKKISSFGSLIHFKKENAPPGSMLRCTDDCKVEIDCPYSAKKLYLNMELTGWPVNTISDDLSYEGRLKALKEGPYGRCVYQCDNDAVDHQVVSLEFDNGVTASFTMTAFTELGRKIRIMGTMGEVSGDGKNINYVNFRNGEKHTYVIEHKNNSMHGGGDYALMEAFIKAVRSQDRKYISSTLEVSVQSHIMAFAAEESRVKRNVVFI
jgi:predicted dehydrogenase